MKIACLQFAPKLGDVKCNIQKANAILEESELADLRWLILPELAFTGIYSCVTEGVDKAYFREQGYNFESLEAITPFLEATSAGVSTQWAQAIAKKLSCFVTVGYPEFTVSEPSKRYNSTVTVAPNQNILVNYRKSHLYYTDDSWAFEGKPPFFTGNLEGLGEVALGICMDINPHLFMAPWDKYEFASNALAAQVPVVAISMAWLTRLSLDELVSDSRQPDTNCITYWIERFSPILNSQSWRPTTIICANRCGNEGEALYAGSSTIMSMQDGKVTICGVLGRNEEKCLITNVEL